MKFRIWMCMTVMVIFAAMSLPVRLAGQVTGSGTTNFIPKWSGSMTLGNSVLFQSGSQIGIGTTSPAARLDVIGLKGMDGTATTSPTSASKAFHSTGGTGGNLPFGQFGTAGTGGGLQFVAGNGGSTGSFSTSGHAFGGTGAAVLITGGTGGGHPGSFFRGGDGGSIMLQPGVAGGSTQAIGQAGNVILATNAGKVGIGTTTPPAKLYVAGNFIATGTKSALVETASYGKRQLYAMESPENWFEDFGAAQLVHGRATVKLDLVFAETVSTADEYHVFLTPKGDCKGLYVASQSATSFEVRELRHGKGTVRFDYRIVAKRRGHERERLVELKDPRDAQAADLKVAEK